MKHYIDQIIHHMALFLGREDIYLDACNQPPGGLYMYRPERDMMMECVNYTARLIAEEYFPLTRVETHSTDEQCRVAISSFDKKIFRIIEVLDSNGKKTTFRTFDDFIKLCSPQSSFEFVYQYIPEYAQNGQFIETVSMISERVLAMGACATFCLATGMYDEAKMWDERFYDAMAKLKQKNDHKRILPRTGF